MTNPQLAAGAAAYERGDIAEALRIFEQATRSGEPRIRLAAMVNAASMADNLGDHHAAVRWFEQALAEMPEDAGAMRPTALVNMSQALQNLGDPEGAARALSRARALLADDPEQGTLRVACLLSSTAVAIHRQEWAQAIELARESLTSAAESAPHLAGHPLLNLAAVHFETGRRELALDFAHQALDAFTAAADHNGVAETQQNLALMHLRSEQPESAEPLLASSQDYFERAGLIPRAGIGSKALAFLAETRGDTTTAYSRYTESLRLFTAAGAELEAADVRIRLATMDFALGRREQSEHLLAAAFQTYAARNLGLHCARIDFWHAALLESGLDYTRPDPAAIRPALDLAVTSALALDAVRHTFASGSQRHEWDRHLAEPALRLAFRLAYLAADAPLLRDLIETRCAGAIPAHREPDPVATARLPLTLPEPPSPPPSGTLRLGTALAEVATAAGLAISPPPRLRVGPGDRIALADHIAAAEQRYGLPIRDSLVLTP